MLINKNTRIIGQKTILVPYREEHVLKYHNWMKSEELQKLTASEPLTLAEEYEMQKSWTIDENKCTFIVLDREKFESTRNEIDAMIGDTNLFFSEGALCAEAEIMIAEPWARGRKCGCEAMILMLLYGIQQLSIKQFIVKISEDNAISINMFTQLGFVQIEHSKVFKELTFSKLVDNPWIEFLQTGLKFEIEINE